MNFAERESDQFQSELSVRGAKRDVEKTLTSPHVPAQTALGPHEPT